MNPPEQQARELIARFIDAVNRRDADAAQATLGADAVLVFPGPTEFRQVRQFLEWAGPRYRSATYVYGAMDFVADGDRTIVYAQGHLDGEFPDGTSFRGVRYLDRFVIAGGRIRRKEVWSDMADLLRRLQR